MKIAKDQKKELDISHLLKNQEGRIGYLIAWFLGVPVSVLFVIFLIRGH